MCRRLRRGLDIGAGCVVLMAQGEPGLVLVAFAAAILTRTFTR